MTTSHLRRVACVSVVALFVACGESSAPVEEAEDLTELSFEDSDMIEVSTPELDDVVRLDDRYGRT